MSKKTEHTYILGAKRTAIGSFQGQFDQVPAPLLGARAIAASLSEAQVPTEDVDEVIMGQVLSAGVGQAPARQAALGAGVPPSAPCMTINKVCGSGLKAVMLADQGIRLMETQVAVAGGQENMTLAPHLLEKARKGYRMGSITSTDSMIKDGLWDPYNDFHMGSAAELCAQKYGFTREEQDAFAKESYQWAIKAQDSGFFDKEIIPVEVKNRKTSFVVKEDEEPQKVNFEKMPLLKPAFQKEGGTITAANASKINDGAAALVLASSHYVETKGLKPMARLLGSAPFAQEPQWFTTAPVGAMKKLCEKTGIKMEAIDLFEINEAFSVVTMTAIKELGLARDKVNVHGGAVALGHPIGASGARILTTLVHALKTHRKQYGMASLCLGGGEAVAMMVENL